MTIALIRTLTVVLALASLAKASTEKYRLIWNGDPSTTATIGWSQVNGENPGVRYGTEDHGASAGKYPHLKKIDRLVKHREMNNAFARLTELKPDTKYFFVVQDTNSISRRFWFRTAPAGEEPMAFVAGGDSRNNRDARRNANTIVRKLRPLFVTFGGDFTDNSSVPQWQLWFDDWQLTTSDDGLMIPIIAARGNHEHGTDVHNFFDTPNDKDLYTVGFGNYVRIYTLNSNIVRGGDQAAWLAENLAAHHDTRWKIAHYHHPIRPHHAGKSEQDEQYKHWAPLFYKHGMNLTIECDSHTVKRTWPLRPTTEEGNDEGFMRDDARGTVFIGEGCWGAPLRAADDAKSWTRDTGRLNQVNWIVVSPQNIQIVTVSTDNADKVQAISDSRPFPTRPPTSRSGNRKAECW